MFLFLSQLETHRFSSVVMILGILEPSMTQIPLRRDPVSIILKNASIRLCLDAGPALLPYSLIRDGFK